MILDFIKPIFLTQVMTPTYPDTISKPTNHPQFHTSSPRRFVSYISLLLFFQTQIVPFFIYTEVLSIFFQKNLLISLHDRITEEACPLSLK